ncbi:T6SS immunity protein Tdi1 domain-containing protein [Microbacterium sp. LBN7]|uniref:T6SS immunity protein Tdi1 domain-containing protein n=1 Tax=Microbacterium sp. LBN7 TaxID=3129773 RepID=UPI00389105A0
MSRTLNWDIFARAVEAHGELPYEQSFTFVPLRSLGGPEKVENLKKRETIAAIQVMVEFQGVIGH